MGSKSRIAKYIVPIIQKYVNENDIAMYIEPFVGGANIIDKIKCDIRIGIDINPYLTALLKRVQNGESLYEEVSKELYDNVRASYNNKDNKYADWEYGNVGFLASYNGRFLMVDMLNRDMKSLKMARCDTEIIIEKAKTTYCLKI